jgi:hypothetical protein
MMSSEGGLRLSGFSLLILLGYTRDGRRARIFEAIEKKS